MIKVYIIHVTEQDRYYNDENKVHKMDSKDDALSFVNDAATGRREGVKVKRVYEVDVQYGVMKELHAQLDGFKLVLVEKDQ